MKLSSGLIACFFMLSILAPAYAGEAGVFFNVSFSGSQNIPNVYSLTLASGQDLTRYGTTSEIKPYAQATLFSSAPKMKDVYAVHMTGTEKVVLGCVLVIAAVAGIAIIHNDDDDSDSGPLGPDAGF